MHIRKIVWKSGVFLISVCAICLVSVAQNPPRYRVDASWPKELPNHWIIGHVQSVVVDRNDHIWVLHFPRSLSRDEAGLAQKPPLSECCVPAPAVLEFDVAGNLLSSWGGPGYLPTWPAAERGLWVDKKDNVWISGNWAGVFLRRPEDDLNIAAELVKLPWDRHVLKLSRSGKLLLQIGRPEKGPANNQDTSLLGGPSSMQVDEDARELYVADGHTNRRVVVYDSESGRFKRGWGAYGIPLSAIENSKPESKYDPSAPPAKQFRGPLVGIRLSTDGLIYVGDRENNRIQVFTKQGKFMKEFFVAPQTLGEGSVTALALSHDRDQKFLFVGDGSNNVIWVLNRVDGSVVTRFGHRGHDAGQFSYLQTLDLDSRGNIYTGEVRYNNRLQKFVPEQ